MNRYSHYTKEMCGVPAGVWIMNMDQLMKAAAKARSEGKFVTVRNEDVAKAMFLTMVQNSLTGAALVAGLIATIIFVAKMF